MVSELAKVESPVSESLLAIFNEQPETGVTWFDRLRTSAWERFTEVGFPTVKDEEWKYTNVAPITRLDFSSTSAEADVDVASFRLPETNGSELVCVNGKLRPDLSSLTALPDGVLVRNLASAVQEAEYSEIVKNHLARTADYVTSGFNALNTAFISSGVFVYIPRNVEASSPIHLLFVSTESQAANFPRALIVAEENSGATIVESYVSAGAQQRLTNSVVEIVVNSGARIEHYRVQRENNSAFHVATTMADLGATARYDATSINLGAELSRHDVGVTMDHEGAECWVDGLYLVTTGQHTDTHSVIAHRKPNCSSHQLYKGILDGKSRAVFNGKIFVRHNAQKTDAMQTNKNLLLSNEARVDTKPQLEILADDVKCAHGAAVGQIDQDELFYLETRGIHPDLGRNLLTYGFAEEVIAKIKLESIKSQLDEAVLHRLNARLEA